MYRLTLLALAAAVTGCNEYDFGSANPPVQDAEMIGPGDGDRKEQFTVADAVTDVVFFGDTSSSMDRELVELGNQVTRFVERMDDHGMDWQVAAVTGPDGCAQNGILTPNTPDYASLFAAGIKTEPSQDDVDEWGLFNVREAINADSPGRCNEGLLRQDALLHIVLLSDERDTSPGWDGTIGYHRDYVDPILDAKAEVGGTVRFSAIAGPVPGGCEGAEAGSGYWEAVDETEGEFLSICDDWTERIDVLADTSVTQEYFPLGYQPVIETIEVYVNDEERIEGWAYESAGNQVHFTTDLPRGGDVVWVVYDDIL